MTLALVEDGVVTSVGLPAELRSIPTPKLKLMGWHVVVGTHPVELPEPGYQWNYGAPWTVSGDQVIGTWAQVKLPQPYPSWTWQDNVGWVAPTAKPEGNFDWDEEAQNWVPSAFDD